MIEIALGLCSHTLCKFQDDIQLYVANPGPRNIDDVAKSHIGSLNLSLVPGNERYILYSHNLNTGNVANAIRTKYPHLEARIPLPSEKDKFSSPTRFDISKANKVFGTNWDRWEDAVFAIVDDILRSEKEQGISK